MKRQLQPSNIGFLIESGGWGLANFAAFSTLKTSPRSKSRTSNKSMPSISDPLVERTAAGSRVQGHTQGGGSLESCEWGRELAEQSIQA